MAMACAIFRHGIGRRWNSLPPRKPSQLPRLASVAEQGVRQVPLLPDRRFAARELLSSVPRSWVLGCAAPAAVERAVPPRFSNHIINAPAECWFRRRGRNALGTAGGTPTLLAYGISNNFPVVFRPSSSRWARCASASG